eukprot:Gb_09065 [translate_table: standard]
MAFSEILVLVLKLSFIIHLSSLSLAHPSPNINSSSSFEDQQSLIAFKKSISNDPFNALQDWNSNLPFCNWTGVTCDLSRERVIEFDLSGMRLHGFLSPRLGNLSSLERLYLNMNTFGGHIPPQLGRLSLLRSLWLEFNQLEGNIPSSLSNCQNLVNFSLCNNRLTCLIPPQLGQLANLKLLNLHGNELSGTIPSSLSNISTLTQLYLATNNLNGAIPPQLGILTQLEYMSLSENQLTRQIPASLSNCTRLLSLDLYDNQLEGHIPLEFGAKLAKLQWLTIGKNPLSGNIPNSLANCSQLTLLDLGGNRLSGTIPMELGGELCQQIANLTNLTLYLDLAFNSFTGRIPSALGRLQKLEKMDLSFNELEGSIPRNIPASLGQSWRLEELDLSDNKLRGKIPPEVAGLQNRIFFNLSGNMLEGRLPPEVDKMIRVQTIDISKNKSNSKLTRPIEKSGRGGFVIQQLVSRCRQKSKNALALNVGYQKISHKELIDATNGFNEANLLGVGSFGAVYKAIFRDGRMSVVKTLNLQDQEAQKSFSTECKALGRVRHRNLVKIITSCSNVQFKALALERVKIAIDIAHAMEYLHRHSPVQVVRQCAAGRKQDCTCSGFRVWAGWNDISKRGCLQLWNFVAGNLDKKRPTDDMFSLQKWVNMAFDECLLTNVSNDERHKICERNDGRGFAVHKENASTKTANERGGACIREEEPNSSFQDYEFALSTFVSHSIAISIPTKPLGLWLIIL